VSAKSISPIGCAYSATKAGIYHFGTGLFEETRKYGVKVVNICLGMTKTPFFDSLNIKEAEEEDAHITPECVAGAVAMILDSREGTVVTEIELKPQINKILRK
jgi:short-subunit dehydrogenase